MSAVLIVDTVTMKSERAERWVRQVDELVVPAVVGLGGEVCVMVGHEETGRDLLEIVMQCRLPDSETYWALRGVTASDERLLRWWRRTDVVAAARRRRVLIERATR